MTKFPDFDSSIPHLPEEGRQWMRDKALYDAIVAMTELLKQLSQPKWVVPSDEKRTTHD